MRVVERLCEGVYRVKFFSCVLSFLVVFCPLVVICGRDVIFIVCPDENYVFVCAKQKIQNELNGHEATLGDMRKKNQDKDASQKLMGQIDDTQV